MPRSIRESLESQPLSGLVLIIAPLGSRRCLPRSARWIRGDGERSRRRVRDLVTQLAFEGLSENEIGRARISMVARSDPLHARAGYRSARPVAAAQQIQLATHGRSIQLGRHSRRFDDVRVTSAFALIATRKL